MFVSIARDVAVEKGIITVMAKVVKKQNQIRECNKIWDNVVQSTIQKKLMTLN
jgi:hypothetical protein